MTKLPKEMVLKVLVNGLGAIIIRLDLPLELEETGQPSLSTAGVLDDASLEPLDESLEPLDASLEPLDASLEPLDASLEPLDASLEPSDAPLSEAPKRASPPCRPHCHLLPPPMTVASPLELELELLPIASDSCKIVIQFPAKSVYLILRTLASVTTSSEKIKSLQKCLCSNFESHTWLFNGRNQLALNLSLTLN